MVHLTILTLRCAGAVGPAAATRAPVIAADAAGVLRNASAAASNTQRTRMTTCSNRILGTRMPWQLASALGVQIYYLP